MKYISGNSNIPFAESLVFGIDPHSSLILPATRFPDGESRITFEHKITSNNICIIQSLCCDENIIELTMIIDSIKRMGVKNVTIAIPYHGYSRQDRVTNNSPISARVIADIIQLSGADNIITMDLHASQISGFYKIPVFDLSPALVFWEHFKSQSKQPDLCSIVSPDLGGVKRARNFADLVPSASFSTIEKTRNQAGNVKSIQILGDNIQNKQCILIDDIVDGASTICKAAEMLIDSGALSVDAYVTHGLFSGGALEKIENSKLNSITVTNSIHKKSIKCKKLHTIDVSTIFAHQINNMNNESHN